MGEIGMRIFRPRAGKFTPGPNSLDLVMIVLKLTILKTFFIALIKDARHLEIYSWICKNID